LGSDPGSDGNGEASNAGADIEHPHARCEIEALHDLRCLPAHEGTLEHPRPCCRKRLWIAALVEDRAPQCHRGAGRAEREEELDGRSHPAHGKSLSRPSPTPFVIVQGRYEL
jgi:hypothetical protein